jgi:hypothetical protein
VAVFDDHGADVRIGRRVSEVADLHGLRHPLAGPTVTHHRRWFGSSGPIIDHVGDLAFRAVANKLAHLQHEGINIAK